MAIPDEDVAQVRAATDIVALIGEHTALKKQGRRFVGLCPFHGERTASFSVNAEEGLYYCFGCQVSGDAISFVRAIEGCDFVEAVERLAQRAGITIRETDDPNAAKVRAERQRLFEAMAAAADFYHERLLSAPDAKAARQYLRRRGYDGEVVRTFHLGYAPAGYDALAKAIGRFSTAVLGSAGLVYVNDSGRAQDVFRERVIFPIADSAGRAIALGGRYLPEELRSSTRDPGPKYRNSPESSIYQKRRTLYGLNWAKTEMSHKAEAVICEGYTDVIGFHRAGIARAVATCGTALTEEHLRVIARFAKRVVLVFDADAAGQNAAARLYEWERRHELEVCVATLPDGADPGSLAENDPEALRAALDGARPHLAFSIERAFLGADLTSPEARSRAADGGLRAIAEHPDDLVRDAYLREIADRTRFSADDLRARLEAARVAIANGAPSPLAAAPPRVTTRVTTREADYDYDDGEAPVHTVTTAPRARRADLAGRDAITLAIHEPQAIAGRLDEVLFLDDVQRGAYRALASATELHEAIASAPDESAELLRRLAVIDVPDDIDVDGTLVRLVRNAGEAALRDLEADARRGEALADLERFAALSNETKAVKEALEALRDPLAQVGGASGAVEAAERLLAWLRQHNGGGGW